MKTIFLTIGILLAVFMAGCGPDRLKKDDMGVIPEEAIVMVVGQLVEKHGEALRPLIERGVKQTAALWKHEDGTVDEFKAFCLENYIGDEQARLTLFEKLSANFEVLFGYLNQVNIELNKPIHLERGPITPVDVMFGSYAPFAHLSDDLFGNKVAFLTILNFPFYTLDEKETLGANWTRRDWAYARMGDMFTSRVPSAVNQQMTQAGTLAEKYISEYNIIMGQLLNDAGQSLFPENLRLISHWGLRDEIRSLYAGGNGLEKQLMIYQVMRRIIAQDIPQRVINNSDYQWNPFSNEVFRDGNPVEAVPEPDTRYYHLLNNFRAARAADPYSPNYPTAIERAFDAGLEMSQAEVESLFVDLVSSPLLKEVGTLISQRLGRPLQPFDIWYDGFKARSAISEEKLDAITRSRFPTPEAFSREMPNMLRKFGWDSERAQWLSSKITVEGSRGAGHAWGAQMREKNSYLRTRIAQEGMDYKGFNIAIHELGHNVEQTITLHDVDYYLMRGVPNTAFTEALAFIFQVRDLKLLGIVDENPDQAHLRALDVFWGTYEIMGVSLVDMAVWKWMYENPDATPAQLREQTLAIATDVWNKYFAPVFGVNDSPILAVYSHMISYPLYLSAYPLGHLIEFQIEGKLTGMNVAGETDRMFKVGKLTPQHWMYHALGVPVSNQPMFDAAAKALQQLK